MTEIVLTQNEQGVPVVDSRFVAEAFDRNHRDVLRSIANMDCSEDFRARNFAHTPYVHENNGKTYSAYELTRDGFTFLAMGFTGKEAAAWKEKFIAAFNEMERRLIEGARPFRIPQSLPEALRLAADESERADKAEAALEVAQPKLDAFERLDASEGAVSVREAAKMLNVPERKFTKFLEMQGWAFRQNGVGRLQSYSAKLKPGYVEHRSHVYFDQRSGEDRTSIQLMITPKGLARLAILLEKDNGQKALLV